MKRLLLVASMGALSTALGFAASGGDDRTPDHEFLENLSSKKGVVIHRGRGAADAAGIPGTREPGQNGATPPDSPAPGSTPPHTAPGNPTGVIPGDFGGGSRLRVQEVELMSALTGADAPPDTVERWNIRGTDLGISFEHKGKIYSVFGDTFGVKGIEKRDWRRNTMGILEPHPEHGYVLTEFIEDEDGDARELIHIRDVPKHEYTFLPSSAISVGDRMYIRYVSIRDWEKQWWGYKFPIVNGSGFAYSDDDGQTWTVDETAKWEGDNWFTQTAMVRHDGFVYVFGTPAGAFVPARVMRVPEDKLLEPDEYTYWDGESWNEDPASAAIIVDWPVGLLSVKWSEYHQRWLMMYKNEVDHTIVLRTAPNLEGPWDEERVVVTDEEFPSLYGPLIVPGINSPDVYFTMSVFFPYYNVSVMRVRLE